MAMRWERGGGSDGWATDGTSAGTPGKRPVVGTDISSVRFDDVLAVIDRPPPGRAQVMSFCNVHSVMTARRQAALAEVLNASDVAAPDGMPIVWWMRLIHGVAQTRVDGPTVMDLTLRVGMDRGWRHYLYGATPATLQQLRDRLAVTHPDAIIVGTYAPPFRPLTPAEEAEVVERIRSTEPTVVWVGLGMPKQEMWMHEMRGRLPGMTLMGVGAAFDMLAGRTPRAPAWMRNSGLEWVYRLLSEPRRLWRRYAANNPAYLVLLAREVLMRPRRSASA